MLQTFSSSSFAPSCHQLDGEKCSSDEFPFLFSVPSLIVWPRGEGEGRALGSENELMVGRHCCFGVKKRGCTHTRERMTVVRRGEGNEIIECV